MNEKSQSGRVLFYGRTDWLDTLSKTLLLLSLMSQQILAQVSGSLEIVNVTKDTIIFSDNFESGIAGGAPGADDPKVGTWSWNSTPVTEIRGLENTKKMIAAEGSQYLKIARMPERVKLTAIGDDDAAIEGEEGDTVEIRFSFFYESGYASIYPGSIDGDSAQITFFPGGEVRIYGGADVGWNILDQTYNEGDWNEVVIQYINDSGEHSISVNGAEFETYEGVSSEDNGSGGYVDGFRLQGDGGGTMFFIDAVEVVNVTKNRVIFSDNFESGIAGESPGMDDPDVGTWDWNGSSIAEIMGPSDTEEMTAAEGSQYLRIARLTGRPKLTAIGNLDAADAGEEGDTVEIRFSLYFESGYASIYPRSGDGDSAQITFFPDGEVRIYGGGDVGWNILDQTYNEGEWNQVIIQYVNGSGEYSISVNGAEFETYEGVSSEDNGSGGNLDGFRLQGDGGNTIFYLDGIQGTEHEPIKLKYTNFGGVAFKAIEGKDYEIQVSHDLKQWSELGEIKDASGDVEFIDPRQPLVPFKKNFFRVKLVE
ncbi:MAG: hypothetical protein DSZ35_11245 [Verrucomicrobia bacterium]|nr:MAG: hypothetical protein DSZ35_11245 [Verrucomicrobiota bacterium]